MRPSALVGTALFALAATKPDTSYYTFAVYIILIAVGGGVAYWHWMAAYTETVEKHNPAATATGLAIWGWIIRASVTVALAMLPGRRRRRRRRLGRQRGRRALADRWPQYPQQVATTVRRSTTPTLATLQKRDPGV